MLTMFRFAALLVVVTSCWHNPDDEAVLTIEPTEVGGVRTITKVKEFENKEAYRLFRVGRQLERRDRYDLAKRKYHQALKIDPENPIILNALGLADMTLNNFDSAETSFKKAIHINPEYFGAMNNLGLLYYYSGKYDSGIAILREVPIDELNDIGKCANFYHQFMNYTGLAECDSAVHYYHLAKEFAHHELYLKSIKEFMQEELVFHCPEFALQPD